MGKQEVIELLQDSSDDDDSDVVEVIERPQDKKGTTAYAALPAALAALKLKQTRRDKKRQRNNNPGVSKAISKQQRRVGAAILSEQNDNYENDTAALQAALALSMQHHQPVATNTTTTTHAPNASSNAKQQRSAPQEVICIDVDDTQTVRDHAKRGATTNRPPNVPDRHDDLPSANDRHAPTNPKISAPQNTLAGRHPFSSDNAQSRFHVVGKSQRVLHKHLQYTSRPPLPNTQQQQQKQRPNTLSVQQLPATQQQLPTTGPHSRKRDKPNEATEPSEYDQRLYTVNWPVGPGGTLNFMVRPGENGGVVFNGYATSTQERVFGVNDKIVEIDGFKTRGHSYRTIVEKLQAPTRTGQKCIALKLRQKYVKSSREQIDPKKAHTQYWVDLTDNGVGAGGKQDHLEGRHNKGQLKQDGETVVAETADGSKPRDRGSANGNPFGRFCRAPTRYPAAKLPPTRFRSTPILPVYSSMESTKPPASSAVLSGQGSLLSGAAEKATEHPDNSSKEPNKQPALSTVLPGQGSLLSVSAKKATVQRGNSSKDSQTGSLNTDTTEHSSGVSTTVRNVTPWPEDTKPKESQGKLPARTTMDSSRCSDGTDRTWGYQVSTPLLPAGYPGTTFREKLEKDSSVAMATESDESEMLSVCGPEYDNDSNAESTVLSSPMIRRFPDDQDFSRHQFGTEYMYFLGQDDNEAEELPLVANTVDSRKFTNALGLPEWRFSVYGGDDSVLHCFRAFAAKSQIPGAGNGAFIEYMGARRLTEPFAGRRERLLSQLHYREPASMQPLHAMYKDGGVTVTLTGENLHGNRNRTYWSQEALDTLEATIPPGAISNGSVFTKMDERIRLVSCIYEIPEYEANYVGSGNLERIGHHGTNLLTDYSSVNNAVWFDPASSGVECIDLGRYGPFRKKDRKPEDFFALKNFVFSQVPGEWSFAARENIYGQIQNIDITDDVTGEPHELARAEIPMYVNEVGAANVRQNVFIGDENDRVVKYHFRPDGKMKRGVAIELFTNYRQSYEANRERKGYGRRNRDGTIKSDDDLGASMQRGFWDRHDASSIVDDVPSLARLDLLVRNIYIYVFRHLEKTAREFLQLDQISANQNLFSPLQLVALKRLEWLSELFNRKAAIFEDAHSIRDLLCYMRNAASGIFSHLLERDFGRLAKAPPFQRLEEEYVAEACFDLRHRLHLCMDSAFYCPVALQLVREMSRSIIKHRFGCLKNSGKEETLMGKFLEAARSAKSQITSGSHDDLVFASGVPRGCALKGDVEDLLSRLKLSNAFFVQHTTFPKGIRAALLQYSNYRDCLTVMGESVGSLDRRRLPLKIPEQVVMATFSGFEKDAEIKLLGAVPKDASAMKNGGIVDVNRAWYIYWQVVWIVDIFARHYVPGYSLQNLCKDLGLDFAVATFVSERSILPEERDDSYKRYKDFCTFPEPSRLVAINSRASSEGSKKKASAPRPRPELVYKGEPTTMWVIEGENWPKGWWQETYRRMGGETKGGTDNYWYPPEGHPKLRSKPDIIRYINRVRNSEAQIL